MELNQRETKEVEPKDRKVVLHFVRHGDAGYSGKNDAEGYLTEKGREQAYKIGEQIYQDLPEGAILEFLSSNRERAVKTVEAIEEKIKELERVQNKNLIFHDGKREKTLTYERLGISDEITQEYFGLIAQKESPIRYWLEHPGKTPDEVQKNFGSFVRHMSRLANNLNPGPDVHIIFPTHSGPTEVFAGQILEDPSIRSLANCEQFTIELSKANIPAVISYKDQRKEIIL